MFFFFLTNTRFLDLVIFLNWILSCKNLNSLTWLVMFLGLDNCINPTKNKTPRPNWLMYVELWRSNCLIGSILFHEGFAYDFVCVDFTGIKRIVCINPSSELPSTRLFNRFCVKEEPKDPSITTNFRVYK